MNRRGRHARLPLLIGLLFLLALIPFTLFRGSQVPEAEAAWWNESWQYRQSIAVTNNTTEQTNVYIAVSLDTSNTSKFQADCGDLRFTKQNGQLLPYYIVSGCGTASTNVHVQLDTFPAGAQTFYAYYGNPSADNGFASADFLIEATSYTVGGIGSEEIGPGPVAYWKFDEGSGQIAHDSAGYSPGQEVLVDGDMEAGDVNAWTAAYSILSKESDNPHGGSNYLRITPTSSYPAARQQVLTIGQSYRFRGWVRIQAGQEWRVRCTTTNIIVGTGTGDWEYIDVHFVATTDTLGLSGVNAAVPVEWDDVSLTEASSGNHGTISGATWASEDQCVRGKCLSFDGNDYVTVPDHSSLEPASAITLSAWIYPTNPTYSFQMIIDKQPSGGSGAGYTLRLDNSTGKVKFRAVGTSGNDLLGNTILSANTWYHVVGVYDGSNFKLFINGQEDASKPSTGNIIYDASDLQIGRRVDGFNFKGRIDEPKIFPYALTEDQIKVEYNLGTAVVMGSGPTVAPPASGTLKASLVAHWAFDEQYGQSAHDKVGNNHGTFGASTSPGSDDPTWKSAGECKVNGCSSFDGADDYVGFNSGTISNLVNGASAVSISVWIKPISHPAINQRKRIVSSTAFGVTGLSLSLYNNGSVEMGGRSIAGDGYQNATAVYPSLNEWHHALGILDFSNDQILIYIDGSLQTTQNVNFGAAQYTPTSTGADSIGSWQYTSDRFDGLIDEVKIYNTALTADQVKQDMNAGASVAYSVGSQEADELADGAGAPPITEWKFDEKQGSVAYDSSGNANDGTVNGATWKSGCQQGACLEFDGVDDFCSTSDINSLDGLDAITISAWIKGKAFSGLKGIVTKWDSNDASWFLGHSGDEVRFYLASTTSDYSKYITTNTANLEADNWYHVEAVYGQVRKLL